MSIFSERIKDLKISKKLLQKDIAKEIGVSLRAYQYYETDQREPTMSVLLALAKYFDVSLDYLTGRTNEPSNPTIIYQTGYTENSNYAECKSNNDYNIQNHITEDEQELVSNFRILDVHEKYIIKGRIAEMIYNKDIEQNEFSDELCNINLMDKLNK